MRQAINGILLLDKPIGLTSNGVLQRVKRLFNAKKAGHTGSLDPIATGMLPLCFGEATKFSQFLLDSDKTYEVTAKLGEQTNTGDSEGEIIATRSIEHVTLESIQAVIPNFIGTIAQVPPMFSAIKFQGKPLYELARRGIEIERKARNVTIFTLELLTFKHDLATFRVHCSKGTYVRTLIEDIGNQLGCGAHVVALRRTSVSPYGDTRMFTLEELEALAKQDPAALTACLLSVQTAVSVFPAVKLNSDASFYLRMGQPVRTPLPSNTTLVRLISDDAKFLGMGEVLSDGRVKPHRLVKGLPAA